MRAELFEEWQHQAHLRSGHSNGDVDVVPVDDVLTVDDGIDDGQLLQGVGRGLDEGRHEAQLDAVALHEGILQAKT